MSSPRIYESSGAQYIYNLVLSVDQLVNAILLGDPDQSLSGRCGRAVLSGRPRWWVPALHKIIDWIFLTVFKEENHCVNAIEHEELLEKELWRWYHKD